MDQSESNAKLLEVLSSTLADEMGEAVMVTGWVVLVECIDSQGENNLACHTSQNLPVWRKKGMLHDVLFGEGWTRKVWSEDKEED